jgi:hypothetical protein
VPKRRSRRRRVSKKRNLAAKLAVPRPGAGPMKDKRKKSRQQQRVEDEKRAREILEARA